MKRTRAVTITALAAASAMVFAACSSSPGQSTPSTSSAPAATSGAATGAASVLSAAPSSGAASSGTASSGTASSGSAGTTSQASGTEGCGKPHGPYADPGAAKGTVVTGNDELAASWNSLTSHGNSIYNSDPNYFTQAQIWYYDKGLALVNNDSFITCVITSKTPLTIKYTINAAAKWSDGVPVTADDLLMQWISQSGKFQTGAVKVDNDGNPLANGKSDVAFDASGQGMALIKDMPTISADRKSMTVVLTKPYVDANLLFSAGVPAHVIGQKALGIADPTKAVEAIQTAAEKDDKASLSKIANFFNTGFDFTSLPSDKSLYLSDGAYLLTAFKANQFMTFTANPDYTWGPKPSVQTITYEYLNNPTAAVQALGNGEIQLMEPAHPTTDVSKGLGALSGQGVKTVLGVAGAYEHVDLVFDNKGPFDPATYGGDAAKANDVRQAFLKMIPRQSIVDRLIKPISAAVTVRDSFSYPPGAPGYKEALAANGMSAFDAVDLAGAKALLAKAGVTSPTVRILYSATSTLRQQEFQLIAASASQAGFKVVDGKDPDWSSHLPNTNKYDASIFAWVNSNLGVSQGSPPNYTGKENGQWVGQNNYGHYNNPAVNTLMDKLLLTSDLSTQISIQAEMEKNLVTDGFGTILYQYPDVVGYDSTKISNISSIPVVPQVFWNYWEWKLTS